MEKKQDLENCLERTQEILKRVREIKEEKDIQKILPSWSVLNQLHSTVSSLLEYHR